MRNVLLLGEHFLLSDFQIQVFGLSLTKVDDRWILNEFFGVDTISQVSKIIGQLIDQIPKFKGHHEIQHIVIDEFVAAALIIEGVITKDHLNYSSEDDNYITLEDVKFGDKEYRLVIKPSAMIITIQGFKFSIAIIDQIGMVLAWRS
jgi:hypothetical protein